MNILFLGAGKRLSLLERFLDAGRAEEVELRLLAIESDKRVPIAEVAEIITGPAFLSPEFGGYLAEIVQKHDVDVVIPNMDSATVALSTAREALADLGCWAAVSDPKLCAAMFDKATAADWFTQHDIRQPATGAFPCIIKPRRGYGARGQKIALNAAELEMHLADFEAEEALVQAFVEGPEYSVDAYVDRQGQIAGLLTRRRLQVVDGEVEVSQTCRHEPIIALSKRVLAQTGWQGPVTLQFIDAGVGPVIIEVNPRFGGGVTHAIHCGLDMPAWLIRERLGKSVGVVSSWPEGSLMTRCRRDVFHDPEH